MADVIKRNKNETIMYAEPRNVTTVYKTSRMPAPTGSEQIGKTKLDAPAKTRGVGTIDIRGYFGDERDGIRKAGVGVPRRPPANVRMMEYSDAQAAKLKAKKAAPPKAPARKLTEINVPGGGLRTAKVTPAGGKSKQMAVNPRTGSTLGFTTGSRTGSTATKSGVAGKTKMSGSQRMAQNAFNKGGVAGPRKDSSGRNVSSASGKRK